MPKITPTLPKDVEERFDQKVLSGWAHWPIVKEFKEDLKHFLATEIERARAEERERILNDQELWEYLRNPNCLAAKLRLEELLTPERKP